ncbi:MAG: hypothetical protein U0T75_10275 [Chitinophagales bacterium]
MNSALTTPFKFLAIACLLLAATGCQSGIIFTGTATNSPHSAKVGPYYVAGKKFWPDSIVGKKIVVKGLMKEIRVPAEPKKGQVFTEPVGTRITEIRMAHWHPVRHAEVEVTQGK